MGSEPLILLDTHALIWLDKGDPKLGTVARRAADKATASERLAISAISFWEVALLQRKGRLTLPLTPESWRAELLDRGLREIAVSGDTAIRAAALEDFHADPADRIIVVTALFHGSVLLTADDRILRWRGTLRRQDARR